MRLNWIALPLLVLASACSGEDDEDAGANVAIVDTPLGGLVDGESWTVARAETDAFLSEGEPDYFSLLYASDGVACESSTLDAGNHLLLGAPREPGEYPMSLRYNATFVIEGDTFENLVATRGRVVIDEVTDMAIRGGAYIHYDADNSVNGRFEITICP